MPLVRVHSFDKNSGKWKAADERLPKQPLLIPFLAPFLFESSCDM